MARKDEQRHPAKMYRGIGRGERTAGVGLRLNIFLFVLVNTIALAKPEKARMVESMLIQMAQTGQIQGKVQSSSIRKKN